MAVSLFHFKLWTQDHTQGSHSCYEDGEYPSRLKAGGL